MKQFLALIAVCTFAVASLSFPVFAKQETIVAVVNQGVVTASDLSARLELIAASTGLPPSKELKEKLRPQVLDMLIEEQVKIQESARLKIDIDPKEVDQGFEMIARQNNIPVDVFKKALSQRGIRLSTMNEQIKAQLAWTKVVQKRIRPRVEVTDADIDTELESLRANIGKDQYRVAEIFLPVSEKSNHSEVQSLAKKLSDQLKTTPQAFGKVAQQFSQSAGAEQGGMIGWVFGGQLAEEVDNALPSLVKGQVSSPIESAAGYYILLMVDTRKISEETLPSRDDLMQRIGTQRLDRAQRRYLMDLYSAAFIEKRV